VSKLKNLKQHDVEVTFSTTVSLDWFQDLPSVTQKKVVASHPNVLHLTVLGDMRQVIQIAAEHGAINFVSHEPSLEDIFLRFYMPDTAPVTVG
jgi:ABC-2 type transport system ATP-binding protein